MNWRLGHSHPGPSRYRGLSMWGALGTDMTANAGMVGCGIDAICDGVTLSATSERNGNS